LTVPAPFGILIYWFTKHRTCNAKKGNHERYMLYVKHYMTLSIQDQIKNQIEAAQSVLILAKSKAPSEAVAASWGFFHLLASLGKQPTILQNGGQDEKLSFLPRPKRIEEKITGARDFVISFSTKFNKILGSRVEKKDDTYEIYITPEKETVDPRDFSFIPAKFKYDLVVVLGCQNLEQLGELKEKNSDLFFEVPIINVDNRSANENFGQLNLVDITASSLCEILADFAKIYWTKQVTPDSAQCFLAGLVSATSNFQSPETTPQTFMAASWLIEKGASQQKIIRNLFKTQSFSFMKLWGRVMARLNWDEEKKMAWSLVSIEDFVQSRTKPLELPMILEKIKENFSAGKLFVILYSETLERSIALLKNGESESLQKIQTTCGGEIKNGHLEIVFEGKNILEAEKELLGKLE
jgi:bifunctional oligoribonuclease and PAP phosphatase NrnA